MKKKGAASMAAKVRVLQVGKRHARLDKDAGRAVIAAHRRGVSIRDLTDAIGLETAKSSGSLYQALGTWALHHCECAEKRS